MENNNDLNIFICSHSEFETHTTNDCYKIVDVRKNKIKERNNLDDKFYSELLSFYNVSEYANLPKYVGFCHYRRYFDFLDDIPDIDNLFKEYGAIVSKPLEMDITVKEQYALFHNLEDLYIIGGIIAEKYPEYAIIWRDFLNGKILIPYNMFIMKKEDFKRYIEFVFNVLDEYIKLVGTDINKRIYDNIEKYVKNFKPNDTIEYQYRIGGFLGERLTNLFLLANFAKMTAYPVIITENKYNLENNSI